MVTNHRPIANLIAAPNRHVVTDFYVKIDGIVLQYKTVFAHFQLVSKLNGRTNIADQAISFFLTGQIFLVPDFIYHLTAQWSKHAKFVRWIKFLDVLKIHHRQAFKLVFLEKFALNGKGANFMIAIL